MERIYLDNGATSFPKAPEVASEMKNYIENVGCNISRGGYTKAYDLEATIYETREMVSDFFNFGEPKNVCFTPSVTYSLNFVISGVLKKGDHVIISGVEHNAVARPVYNLRNDVEYTVSECDSEGFLDMEKFEKSFKDNTKLVVIAHGSNVCGTVQDIEKIGSICREKGVFFVVDAAQTAGIIDIDFRKCNMSGLCVPAHKGLLGPQGLGLLMVTDELAGAIDPVILGGTGSLSDLLEMPDFLPDRFEPGTLNIPGIVGLNAALRFVRETGTKQIWDHEIMLTKAFLNGLKGIDGIRVVGADDLTRRTGVVSIDFLDVDNSDASFALDDEYGIMTRCGLHCSPLAHKTLGTFPQGTVRFSFGFFNTMEDVKTALKAVGNIVIDYKKCK
ncbi:MAG: aminotransferase class V-fold PLP-dependent enzyme [Clostridia bacterium]|nr:aminotransferase class V-fold PLP-dependent enzyme [Clostridia bacterium]